MKGSADMTEEPQGKPAAGDGRETGDFADLVRAMLVAGLLALVIRAFAFEPFNIPSGSMLPNLLIGDYIFVSKYSYGYSKYSLPFGIVDFDGRIFEHKPARGDVIVFRQPKHPEIDYIKRLIGLPGDRMQMISGVLHINGEPVPRAIVGTKEMKDDAGFTFYTEYQENLPGGVTHTILELSDMERLDETPEILVPEGFYFMMGDNRDSSLDSRATEQVGLVPAENLVGRAEFIFFSTEGAGTACQMPDGMFRRPLETLCSIVRAPFVIRWGRLFNAVH